MSNPAIPLPSTNMAASPADYQHKFRGDNILHTDYRLQAETGHADSFSMKILPRRQDGTLDGIQCMKLISKYLDNLQARIPLLSTEQAMMYAVLPILAPFPPQFDREADALLKNFTYDERQLVRALVELHIPGVSAHMGAVPLNVFQMNNRS